jgi:hypothetical protein
LNLFSGIEFKPPRDQSESALVDRSEQDPVDRSEPELAGQSDSGVADRWGAMVVDQSALADAASDRR